MEENMTRTIDIYVGNAADGREASGMLSPLSPDVARMYGIAPEPSVLRVVNGVPVYDNSTRAAVELSVPPQPQYQPAYQ